VVRVLFSSTWGVGHVFPMVPLAQALVRAGHHVRWVAHGPACDQVTAAGIEARPGGLDRSGVREALRRMDEINASVPGRERASLVFPTMFGEYATPPMVVDLQREAAAFDPDVMIHEPAELAAPLVAALRHTPCITHSWGPAIPAAILSSAQARLAPLWSAHGLVIPSHAGLFSSGYLDICPPSVQFVATDHITGRQAMRPGLYSGEPSGAPVSQWLTPDTRPMVYVTLGTVTSNAPAQQAAIDGALACGARVLVTVGPQGDPAALVPRTNATRIERWVPQSMVLRHADLVVSHAGSGAFLGALAAGIPQLCLPQSADQFRNADAVTRSRTGKTLQPEEATPAAISDVMQALLHDPAPRAAALAVAAEITTMPDADQVASTLSTYAAPNPD